MGAEVERTDDGRYLAIVNETVGEPPTWATTTALSREELFQALVSQQIDQRDALSAIAAADHYFSNGTKLQIRHFREIRDRIVQGIARPEEVQSVISDLMDERSLIPKWFLVGVLSLGPRDSASMRGLALFLNKTRDPIAAELALRVLRDSSTEIFLSVARPFVKGVEWDSLGDVQSWAMTFAAALLERGEGLELFDDIAEAALNTTAQPGVRRDARRVIVRLAHAIADDNVLGLSDEDCIGLIEWAREKVRASGQGN